MNVRLLQISDVHLDSTLAGSALGLDASKRVVRARETREAFVKALELARSEAVDLVLIPGDLWDDEAVSADTVAFVADSLRAIAPLPVFIAPGNHDYFAPGCGYDPAFLTSRGLPSWPDNVHVFRESRFETAVVPGLEEVTVTGRAFRANVASSERLLAGRIPRARAALPLAAFHASRLGWEGQKRLITAPFADAELLGQGFGYSALGHYHRHSHLEDARGRVRAAYAGSLMGRSLAETGPHGALLMEVEPAGVVPGTAHFVELDPRRVIRLSLDVTGAAHSDAVHTLLERELQACDARPEDQLLVQLTGRYPRGLEPPRLDETLGQRFFHARMVWDAEPDYDLEALGSSEARTVEARFSREMLERMARAADAEERAVLEEALYIGLDAVTQGRVMVRERLQVEEAEP